MQLKSTSRRIWNTIIKYSLPMWHSRPTIVADIRIRYNCTLVQYSATASDNDLPQSSQVHATIQNKCVFVFVWRNCPWFLAYTLTTWVDIRIIAFRFIINRLPHINRLISPKTSHVPLKYVAALEPVGEWVATSGCKGTITTTVESLPTWRTQSSKGRPRSPLEFLNIIQNLQLKRQF